MKVTWPASLKDDFGKKLIHAHHNIHESDVFSDEGLCSILDEYPRESLGIWTFAEHQEGMAESVLGTAGDLSGAEILEAVRKGKIWLNLRRANTMLPRLSPVADEIFDSLEQSTGDKIRKRDMGILISSPHVHVHYHLDIPMVALFQLRGRKRIWMYPADEEHAPSEHVEGIAHMTKDEGLPFSTHFDESAEQVAFEPGMAITWPQTAPHRIQNEDCLNVSLSCEYMTMPALIKANAIYMNGVLRQRFGFTPRRSANVTASTVGKAVMARAVKLVAGRQPEKVSLPVQFKIDPTSDTQISNV